MSELYALELLVKYTLSELIQMETILQTNWDDLKVDTFKGSDGRMYRVWLSRATVDDGAEYNNQVTIECLGDDGVWDIGFQYQAE